MLNKLRDFALQSVFLIFRRFFWGASIGNGPFIREGVYFKLYTIRGAFNGWEAFIKEGKFIRSFTVVVLPYHVIKRFVTPPTSKEDLKLVK